MKHSIRWGAGFLALSLVMILTAALFIDPAFKKDRTSAVSVTKEEEDICVVIDPGHGGEDGGCVASDGTLEKELNLQVALSVYEILRAAGVSVAVTRDSDTMLYDLYGDLSDYQGKKKTYDLKNRVRFAKESECSLFVSIHMNKFTDERYNGLQVYYSNNDSGSIDAAMRIKEHVRDYLQPENEREIKKAGTNIYVLHRSQMPAVLVECGFLSNPGERELLKDPVYQRKLALCISAGIIDSVSNFQS